MKSSSKTFRSCFVISLFLFVSFVTPVSAYPYNYHNGQFVVKRGDTAYYNISYDSSAIQNPLWLDSSNFNDYTNGTI